MARAIIIPCFTLIFSDLHDSGYLGPCSRSKCTITSEETDRNGTYSRTYILTFTYIVPKSTIADVISINCVIHIYIVFDEIIRAELDRARAEDMI